MNTYIKNKIIKYLLLIAVSIVMGQHVEACEGFDTSKGVRDVGRKSSTPKTIKRTRTVNTDIDDQNEEWGPLTSASVEDSKTKKPKKNLTTDRVLGPENPSLQNINNSRTNGREVSLSANREFPHEFSEQTLQALTQMGLSEKDQVLAAILNSSLYKEMRDDKGAINFSVLSPAKISAFERLGGALPQLEDAVQKLKESRPSPIRNPEFSKASLYSPVASIVLSRQMVKDAKSKGTVRRLGFTAHTEPKAEITPQERLEQNRAENEKFLKLELARGKTKECLEAEVKREIDIFKKYLSYIERRKKQLGGDDSFLDEDEDTNSETNAISIARGLFDNNDDDDLNPVETDEPELSLDTSVSRQTPTGKITKLELETKFLEFTADQLTHLHVNGYDLYFSKDMIDLERVEKGGYTNEMLMKELGKTPIGPDGKPMNYHHLTHYDYLTHKTKSIIILLTGTHHKEYSQFWHFSRKTYRLPKNSLKRELFNPARENFNKAIVALLASDTSSN